MRHSCREATCPWNDSLSSVTRASRPTVSLQAGLTKLSHFLSSVPNYRRTAEVLAVWCMSNITPHSCNSRTLPQTPLPVAEVQSACKLQHSHLHSESLLSPPQKVTCVVLCQCVANIQEKGYMQSCLNHIDWELRDHGIHLGPAHQNCTLCLAISHKQGFIQFTNLCFLPSSPQTPQTVAC